MPLSLQSKVYWVLIGTNDFLYNKTLTKLCSDEVVLMGILRVIEELRMLRPNSILVVNGLLPRSGQYETGRLYSPSERMAGQQNVWEAVKIVNSKLREYCELRQSQKFNIVYFDASDVFVRKDNEGNEYIPKNLMDDFLHPTAEGYQAWGERIADKLRELIKGNETEGS